jgi:GNAT superfamily N-acetyltransferase
MKAHHVGKIIYREDASREHLARYLGLPQRFQLIKAVENISRKIMGSATWGFRGYSRDNVPTLGETGVNGKACKQSGLIDFDMGDALTKTALKEVRKNEDANGESKTRETPEFITQGVTEEDRDDPVVRLTAITDADMKRWQEILIPKDTKCMFVVGPSIGPAYQGLGVGSALLRWGTAHAEADGVFVGCTHRSRLTLCSPRRDLTRWGH